MWFLFLSALGCAASEGVPVTLQWYSVEVECVDDVATWSAPEGVVESLQLRRHERSAWTYYGGTLTDDGTLSVGCSDDVFILYAIAL